MVKTPVKDALGASYKLLSEDTTTIEKFESIRDLIEGFNPHVDRHLQTVSKALAHYQKLHNGEIIHLSAEHLPAHTEEQKKRKKALLLLIQSWTQLKTEIKRVQQELKDSHSQSSREQIIAAGEIIKYAKGPFGIITVAAIIIAGAVFFINKPEPQTSQQVSNSVQNPTPPKQKFQAIIFNDKKIPLTELHIGDGPDCGRGNIPHFHALNNGLAKALDNTLVKDPGACGYGKVKEVQIVEVEK